MLVNSNEKKNHKYKYHTNKISKHLNLFAFWNLFYEKQQLNEIPIKGNECRNVLWCLDAQSVCIITIYTAFESKLKLQNAENVLRQKWLFALLINRRFILQIYNHIQNLIWRTFHKMT